MQSDRRPLQVQGRVRRFTSAFGFFCDVALQLRATDTDVRTLARVNVPAGLRGAFVFGVDYAYARTGYSGGWVAEVRRFDFHAIDTTPEVVALAVARAILDALGQVDGPTLDADRGVVMFPKWS